MDRRRFMQGSAAALLYSTHSVLSATDTPSTHVNWGTVSKGLSYSKSKPLRVLYPRGCLANLQPIVRAFEEYTGVTVELVEAGFDNISNAMLKAKLLGKSSDLFDVAIPSTFSIPDLAEAKVIRDFTEVLERFNLSQRAQSVYQLGDNYQGKSYGLQSSGDAYLLFLRKSWLLNPDNQARYQDRFGYPLDVPKSWEELDRQMAFFHSPEDNKFGGCMFRAKAYAHWEYWIRQHGQGQYPVDRHMEPLLDSDKAIIAMEQMRTSCDYLHPGAAGNGPYENFSLFIEGNCYANLSWGGGQKFYNAANSAIKDDLIITQPPGIQIGNSGLPISYFNWGWSYVIADDVENVELAVLFILIATSAKYSTEGVAKADGFFDPFLSAHFSDESIERVYGRPFLNALEVGLANAIPDFYITGQSAYFSAMRDAIYATLYQSVPANLSLSSVVTKWQESTQRYGIDKQISQWQRLRSMYPNELKQRLSGF